MMENQSLQTVSQVTDAHSDLATWALPEQAITRLGRGGAQNVAFSPDESKLAVASRIGLWLYDVATMNPLALWDTERGLVSTVTFSPDGTLIATGNWDAEVKVWNVQSQQCIFKTTRDGQLDNAHQLLFSPDGQRLASSGGRYGAVYVWLPETGEQVVKFTFENAPEKGLRYFIPLAFSLDGNMLASASPENTFSIWDIEAGERIVLFTEQHTAPVSALTFSPCGQFLVSVDRDGAAYEWDFKEGITTEQSFCSSVPLTYAESRPFPKLVYLADGTLLAAGVSDNTLTVWDAKRGDKLGVLRNEQHPYRINFSPKGSQLAIIDEDKIQVWNIGELAPRTTVIHGHTSVCGSVKFSPDGQILAAGYWSGDIHLRNVQGLKLQTTFRCKGLDMIRSIDFSPCSNKLAATSYDKIVRVWDIRKPDAAPAELTGHQAVLYAVAFSPKGDRLVSADSNGVLGVWNVEHEYKLQLFTEETDWIWSIAFSPDGKHLVSAHQKKRARLWDIENGEQITELSMIHPRDTAKYKGDDRRIQKRLKSLEKGLEYKATPKSIAFSPDGDLIAAGGVFGELRLWDATTYETRMVICLPQGCQRAEALTFSPCGRYLVSGASWQGTDKVSIRLWDVTTGENTATFWSHPTDIQSLAFSPDGTLLASASYDGTILLWDMKPYIPPIHPKSTTK
ncbi:MAG: WD40 repeat domain-containing protein [Candidatus Poribacteria bacterium]|nr:WD40 repeat domain-containing protein [Candidatus Poribacteria bacterium]